jgi:predicted dehydrogenase
MIDAAIVGLGRWGSHFVDSVQGLSKRLRFVRAIDTDHAGVHGFAARHDLRLSTDLADALTDPAIGIVVLATPHSLHEAQVVACAAAGKPVFCEKPLALHKADALRMIDACQRAGVPFGVGHNRRFWPSMLALRRVVASGELGQILHIEGHNSNENSNLVLGGWRLSPAESPGGGMTGAGLHILDAFVNLCGPVKRVHARLIEHKKPPAPLDTVSVIVEFASGASGMLATIRATPFYWRVHVFGTRGSAEALGEHKVKVRKSGSNPQNLTCDPADSLRAELEAFVDAVEGGKPYPIPTTEMVSTITAFEAVLRSIDSGTTVEVDAG